VSGYQNFFTASLKEQKMYLLFNRKKQFKLLIRVETAFVFGWKKLSFGWMLFSSRGDTQHHARSRYNEGWMDQVLLFFANGGYTI